MGDKIVTLRFSSQKKRVVGLDFFNDKIMGIVAEHSSHDVQPCHAFQIDCTYEENSDFNLSSDILNRLQVVVTRLKLRGRPVVLSVPNQHVLVRYLNMPNVPQKALRQAVQVEIGTTIHLPFEDPVFDVIPVPAIDSIEHTSEEMEGCCLVVSPRSVISNMTILAKQAGLIPIAVDMKPLALMRAAKSEPLPSEGLTLLACVREEETALSIFIGPYLYFFRNMDMGIRHDVLDEVQIQSSVSDIVYEVNRVINFFNFNLAETERPLAHLYLYGAHPCRDFIAHEIGQQIGVPASLIWENEFLSGFGHQNSEAMIALGLAMKRGQG